MSDREKLVCQNPNHPFRQKWYYYEPADGESQIAYLHSRKYCVSCASYLNMLSTLLRAAMMPQPSLYGNALIQTTKTQLKALIDEVAL